jgi:hypothetical protein
MIQRVLGFPLQPLTSRRNELLRRQILVDQLPQIASQPADG